MKFRKKPVVIEAVHYLGAGNTEGAETPDWMWKALKDGTVRPTNGGDPLIIKTLEGDLTVSPGDFIIQGVQGELYPCKPDIFAATYDLAGAAAVMDFGAAIKALKAGSRVARAGWNGKGMFVYLVPANAYPASTEAAKSHFKGELVPYNAYLAIKNVNETVSTWVPSVNDVLAEDWEVSNA